MFKVEFRISDAGYEDPYGVDPEFYKVLEAKRILRRICADLGSGKNSGTIMDLNGNWVGQWFID